MFSTFKYCENCNEFFDVFVLVGDNSMTVYKTLYVFNAGGYSIKKSEVLEEKVFHDLVGVKDHIQKCENCGERDLFEIDEKMILVTSILNRKGIKTEFTCEGHVTEFTYGVTGPYLMINLDETKHPDLLKEVDSLKNNAESLGYRLVVEFNDGNEYRDYKSLTIKFNVEKPFILQDRDPLRTKGVEMFYQWALSL